MENEIPDLTVLFDTNPENFPWRAPVPREIEARRAQMDDILIFDILLTAGGVRQPHALYPPRDVQTLRKLLDAIEATSYDGLKKDCLIYFLLKWHQDDREVQFMEERCIPPQFVALADAYWYLDSGLDIPRAVSLLSDARLNRDYVSKILQAISLSDDPSTLILQYIRTAKPILSEPDDIDAYSIALAESSLVEAWQYQRSFLEDSQIRPRVLRSILEWCLTPKPRAKALAQLLSFPFSSYEQTTLHDFALHPPEDVPASSIPVIQDLACVRLIQGGQFAAAVKLDRQIAITPINGTFGSRLNDHARKVAQDRKHTMDEIMAVMPIAERQLLEAELEQMSRESDSASFLVRNVDRRPAMNNGRDVTKVPRKPVSTSAVLPIPQRSGAPRFGGPISAGPISTGASTSVAAARENFESISANGSGNFESISAGRRSRSKSKHLAQEDTDPILESIKMPPTGIPISISSTVPTVPLSISTNGNKPASTRVKEVGSLFETRNSANQAPNAFFKPPPPTPSAGIKRAYPGSARASPPARDTETSGVSTQEVSEMVQDGIADSDVDMPESDGSASKKAKLSHKSSDAEEEEAFNTSVFAGISAHSTSYPISFKPSSTPMPPGGFGMDFDAPTPVPPTVSAPREQPTSNISNQTTRTERTVTTEEESQPSASAPRVQPKRQSSRIPRPAASREDLRKTVPGAFVDEEDEDDVVPPLPPPTPARKGRKPRTTRTEEVKETPRPTRRSTRLSVVSASSHGSSSPEPPSPEVRRTRKAATTRTSSATAKGTKTRKARA